MKKNNQETDLDKLAETGWEQMHETLLRYNLTTPMPALPAKRNLFILVTSCAFFILFFTAPFILNDRPYFYFHPKPKAQSSTFLKEKIPFSPGNQVNEGPIHLAMTSETKNLLHEKINALFTEFKKETSAQLLQSRKKILLEKFSVEKNYRTSLPAFDSRIDPVIKIKRAHSLQQQRIHVSKKVRIFAGAGINVSIANNHSRSFNLTDINFHPGITIILPLDEKLSLQTGLWALSTIHGKKVSTKEKQLQNNYNTNVYYNINTTSIVKASYFDVPLTFHYSINKNWSLGTGLQLSKLYKVNITEQKESFDYNNTLSSATLAQYNSTPARAAAVFQKKVEIKKFESRFIAETNFEKGNFLFSAGYYYGLGKTITLKDANNSSHEYRNEYFKLGIQYRISSGNN